MEFVGISYSKKRSNFYFEGFPDSQSKFSSSNLLLTDTVLTSGKPLYIYSQGLYVNLQILDS